MPRKIEFSAILLTDVLALICANILYNTARFDWGWFGEAPDKPIWILVPSLSLAFFWLVVLFFFGMYRERYAESRFDELVSLAKAVTAGILVLFFLFFIDDLAGVRSARKNLLFYWVDIFTFVAGGRIAVRSVQKALILRGYGTHKALVVGWSEQVEQLYQDIARYPEAGLKIVGAIRMRRDDDLDYSYSGSNGFIHSDDTGSTTLVAEQPMIEVYSIEALPRLIDELEVKDVLIALGSNDHQQLLDVLRLCDGKSVSLKLVPDFYTIIGGMARTEHMYGLPLIEVLPEPMPAWEQSTKRLIDIVVSIVVLTVGLPLWIILGLVIRLSSPGPAIFKQQRVGQHGRLFTIYKFRTMHEHAEAATGPVWATENDPRYTPIGRWLRMTRLDEVPQFWNVLKNEMSLVGPRPERPYFVEKLAREIPLYNRRHRVKPGITGWAQVKWKYDESLEDVRQKVKYDLFYIENVNLRMDLKILFRTIRTALLGSGR